MARTAAAHNSGSRLNQIASKQALANHITDLLDYVVCYDGQPVVHTGKLVFQREDTFNYV